MRGCPRASFAEQPQGLAAPYARATPLLAGQLGAVAAALAGRAGSRLARAVLAVQVSRHTLIRVLMALPGRRPAAAGRWASMTSRCARAVTTRRCWWAWRRASRRTCCRTGRRARRGNGCRRIPEVEVICRDRAGAYANPRELHQTGVFSLVA